MTKYFVYILKSKIVNWYYVGFTNNVDQRLKLHNRGLVKSTKSRKPYVILYFEEFEDSKSARVREKYFKNNAGKEWLERRGIINREKKLNKVLHIPELE